MSHMRESQGKFFGGFAQQLTGEIVPGVQSRRKVARFISGRFCRKPRQFTVRVLRYRFAYPPVDTPAGTEVFGDLKIWSEPQMSDFCFARKKTMVNAIFTD